MDNGVSSHPYLVTGATGLIGKRLVSELGKEKVVVLSRDPRAAEAALGARAFPWDGMGQVPEQALAGVETVFHLAGEPVASSRWTEEKKKRIRESRTLGTRAVVKAIAGRGVTLVCASAVGIYGDRGDDVLDEESAPGEGYLADVCKEWEAEAAAHDGRVSMVRTGIVLAMDGGALEKMLPLFRLGIAGRLGDGRQWMPWIHVDDIVGMFLHAAKSSGVRGPLCGVAPEPVTNANFTRALGHALHRPAVLPAPGFALRVAMGEMAAVVLASQRILPKKAEATGFVFRHRTIDEALASLVGA